jgi:hypothetical protein
MQHNEILMDPNGVLAKPGNFAFLYVFLGGNGSCHLAVGSEMKGRDLVTRRDKSLTFMHKTRY